jgi:adenylate kinase family enzyme
MSRRIHITGASGSGTTTLGNALAQWLGVPHFDTDDFYWQPTDPPFQRARAPSDRQRLMAEALAGSDGWVVSGSLMLWGDRFIPLFDAVIFLYVPTEIRIERLRRRETEEFGEEAVAPGGAMHKNVTAFLDWAATYDAGTREGRSLPMHTFWLGQLPCPVLRLDGTWAVDDLVREVATRIGSRQG